MWTLKAVLFNIQVGLEQPFNDDQISSNVLTMPKVAAKLELLFNKQASLSSNQTRLKGSAHLKRLPKNRLLPG